MLGSVIAPIVMILLQKIGIKFQLIYNAAALIAALVFGNIAALAIYEIIKDDTVFMTSVHAVFLNPLFLITGAYLGVYFLYRLCLLLVEER